MPSAKVWVTVVRFGSVHVGASLLRLQKRRVTSSWHPLEVNAPLSMLISSLSAAMGGVVALLTASLTDDYKSVIAASPTGGMAYAFEKSQRLAPHWSRV